MRPLTIVIPILGAVAGCKSFEDEANYLNNTGAAPDDLADGKLWGPKSK